MLKKTIPAHSVLGVRTSDHCSLGAGTKILFAFLIFFSTAATLPFFGISAIPGFARNNGFVFVVLGLIALLILDRSNLKSNKFLSTFLPFVVVGFLTTIAMAFYLTGEVEIVAGETPLSAIVTGLMWLAFDGLIVFFVSYCYERCTSAFLDRVFDAFLVFVITLCAVQALVMLGIPGANSVFNFINVGDWLSVFGDVSSDRLIGVASEPAAMSLSLGLFCLPYCYCRAVNGGGARYGLSFALLLIFGFLTKATTVYITVAFVLFGVFLARARMPKSRAFISVSAFVIAALLMASLIASLTEVSLVPSGISDTFESVFGKTSDVNNQSTAYRTSTVINDIEIFKNFPIFGVGDGCQGFFYAENIPDWVLSSGSLEARSALSGSIGVLNGGSFLPSILSGYGIVGCVLFGSWIVFCIRTAVRRKKDLGHYYEMFIVSMLACIPVCCMAIGFQGAPVAVFLVFCLPALGAQQ